MSLCLHCCVAEAIHQEVINHDNIFCSRSCQSDWYDAIELSLLARERDVTTMTYAEISQERMRINRTINKRRFGVLQSAYEEFGTLLDQIHGSARSLDIKVRSESMTLGELRKLARRHSSKWVRSRSPSPQRRK